MDGMSPLLSRVRRGTCGTTAAALYRVLVAYYTMHRDNAELQSAIEKCVAVVDLWGNGRTRVTCVTMVMEMLM